MFGVVGIVFAVCAGLPHIEDSVCDGGIGICVEHAAVEICQLAIGRHILDDAATVGTEWSVGRPEGAEDCGGGGGEVLFSDDFVVDFIDESVFFYCQLPALDIKRMRKWRVAG